MQSSLYRGTVGHRRLAPVRHDLSYVTYNLFADVDELPELAKRLHWFGYNGFNLLSVKDTDHGTGDGTSVAAHVWGLVKDVATPQPVTRIFMLTYPRVLGYVFNPLTVYYGLDQSDHVQVMIYEVNNTFGQRHSYVLPADGAQSCSKLFYVSPFNTVEGRYRFEASLPGDDLKLAIHYATSEGPCLSAWFNGQRLPLDDRSLLKLFFGVPLLTFKVIGAIHFEALRLWWKGLKIRPRPGHDRFDVTVVKQDSGVE